MGAPLLFDMTSKHHVFYIDQKVTGYAGIECIDSGLFILFLLIQAAFDFLWLAID